MIILQITMNVYMKDISRIKYEKIKEYSLQSTIEIY